MSTFFKLKFSGDPPDKQKKGFSFLKFYELIKKNFRAILREMYINYISNKAEVLRKVLDNNVAIRMFSQIKAD